MNTYKQLYTQVCDFETLYTAYRDARPGKRARLLAERLIWVQYEGYFDVGGDGPTCVTGYYLYWQPPLPSYRLLLS